MATSTTRQTSTGSTRNVVIDFDQGVVPVSRVATSGQEGLPLVVTTARPYKRAVVADEPPAPPRWQPPAIEKTYREHGLLHIRYNARIERKTNGKCKIAGYRPPYRNLTTQPEYGADSGRYYSLLMGREWRPGKRLMLLDIDTKDEDGTVNGLEFMRLMDLDRFGAPKQRTPSGGFHYLFWVDDQMAERIRNRTTITHHGVTFNVDVKFRNALMNCAPSRISGYGAYEWENPEQLADIPRLPSS